MLKEAFGVVLFLLGSIIVVMAFLAMMLSILLCMAGKAVLCAVVALAGCLVCMVSMPLMR